MSRPTSAPPPRDTERFVVEWCGARASGEQAVAVATSRRHTIAGKYTGEDDPVMLVRTQMHFPATGEVLTPLRSAISSPAACGGRTTCR